MAETDKHEDQKKVKNQGIVEIAKSTLSALSSLLNKKAEGTVSINQEKDGWKLILEFLERKAIPDSMDLLGRYEVKTDMHGEMLNYKQILLRHRNDATELEV